MVSLYVGTAYCKASVVIRLQQNAHIQPHPIRIGLYDTSCTLFSVTPRAAAKHERTKQVLKCDYSVYCIQFSVSTYWFKIQKRYSIEQDILSNIEKKTCYKKEFLAEIIKSNILHLFMAAVTLPFIHS